MLPRIASTTLVLAAVARTGLAGAEPAAPDEPTAATVSGAPEPGQESGLVAPLEPEESALRRGARHVLVVPRTLLDLAFRPLQYGVLAAERHQLAARAKRLFFNDAETMGAFPTARLEAGFGVTFGARFLHRDLFGAGERLALQTGAGGRFRQLHRGAFRTGERFGRFGLELDGAYERRPNDAFYGIGNADLAPAPMALAPLGAAGEARYRHRIARATLVADVRVASDLHVRAAGELSDHAISAPETGAALDRIYQVEELAGFGHTSDAYTELELRWDSRRRASRWEPPAVPAAGSLAAVYAGRSTGVLGAPDFWRAGIDLQHFVRVAAGPRAFALRAHGEAVSGRRDELPFHELPRLGGSRYLRGYPVDRFRDRVAAVASADYQWDLSRNVSASVFVDAGRVFPSVRDLSLDDLRVGYGVGLELHTERTFLARMSVASSIDGGVFFDVAFDPVFELDRRVQRR